MNPMRINWVVGAILAVVFSSGGVARAEFYQDVIRGFELFGYRFSLERNLLGDGWDATAIADYSGGRTFNLGVADVTLTGAVFATGGYTLRGIPRGHFTVTTAGAPLAYTYDFNLGLQDTTFTGSVLINIDTDVNLLGFYDQTFQISNRGTFETDGLLGDDSESLDYDLGPVNVSGNAYADALAAMTQPLFDFAGTENPFAKFSSRATRVASLTETADELRARIASGDILSDEEMAMLINCSMLTSMLSPDGSGNPFDGLSELDELLETGTRSPETDGYSESSTVPEPPTLFLLVLGMAGLRLCRRLPAAA